MASPINESVLEAKLSALEAARPWSPRAISRLEATLRGDDDYGLFRMEPLRYAADKGLAEAEAIDLFLHATKVGLFEMNWHMVCAYCGLVVESLRELNRVHSQFTCSFCSAETRASLDDYIHVAFTISPQVRDIAFRHPQALSAEDYHLRYLFSRGISFQSGATLAQVGAALTRCMAFLAPGEKREIALELDLGVLHAKNMMTKSRVVLFPRTASPTAAPRSIPIKMVDHTLRLADTDVSPRELQNGPASFKYPMAGDVATGKVVVEVENEMDEQSPFWLLQYPAGFSPAPVRFDSFLSGKRLLTNQTFRTLFRAESIAEDESIAVKDVTFLFTDLKGSTAMYDEVGDTKAYYLVRQHFETLGKVVARNSGAIVKTIGDAIMATFLTPAAAFAAALEMIRELSEFSRHISEGLQLKVGLHCGHSIAVTLNDRLDYFGQTVNIAARVQGLADGDEIYLTHDAFSAPGMTELLAPCRVEPLKVSVKGVRDSLQVYKIRVT